MQELEFINECKEKVFSGIGITSEDAKKLFNISDENLQNLAQSANEITRDFNGKKVDIEQLNNIKKNACSEDCTFCGQSAFFDTGIETYQLPPPEEVVVKAQQAKEQGAESYCLVAAWREPSPKDFEKVCTIIDQINKKVGISVECSLGFLTQEQARKLKELKVKRYNHNLETAKSKFPEICTTHTYEDLCSFFRRYNCSAIRKKYCSRSINLKHKQLNKLSLYGLQGLRIIHRRRQ